MVNAQQGSKNSKLKCNHSPGDDKFKGVWNHTDGGYILEYAEKIGLGSRRYELIDIMSDV